MVLPPPPLYRALLATQFLLVVAPTTAVVENSIACDSAALELAQSIHHARGRNQSNMQRDIAMFSGCGRRTLLGMLLLLYVVCVNGSPLSHERYQVTTFGAERRARWSLEGKTAIVTGGTKVPAEMVTSSCVTL